MEIGLSHTKALLPSANNAILEFVLTHTVYCMRESVTKRYAAPANHAWHVPYFNPPPDVRQIHPTTSSQYPLAATCMKKGKTPDEK